MHDVLTCRKGGGVCLPEVTEGQIRGGWGQEWERDFLFFAHTFALLEFLLFLGPLPAAYGGSQARGQIGAVATGLHQSHSNRGSELSL